MMGILGAAWGITGVSLLLSSAIFRLARVAAEAFSHPFDWRHWTALVALLLFMGYAEGYRGFQQRFSPRVAARARYLRERPNLFRSALAPLFCMGFFHATRRRKIVTLSLTLGGIPDGATLSAGSNNGDGTWTLGAGDLQGLTLTPPADFTGTLSLSATATATEAAGDVATTATSFQVTVESVIDSVIVGDEGSDRHDGPYADGMFPPYKNRHLILFQKRRRNRFYPAHHFFRG